MKQDRSVKSANSESESLMLKIETQKSDATNPFYGKKDERDKFKHDSNKQIKDRLNNTKIVLIIILVLITSVYYSLIRKLIKHSIINNLSIKVYHSIFVFIIYIIDKNFDIEPVNQSNISIIYEDDDEQLNDLEVKLLQDKSPNKESKLSVTSTMIFIYSLGILTFTCELLTFYYLQLFNTNENIGLIFCSLSVEFFLTRIYFYYMCDCSISKINLIGLLLHISLNILICIYFFNFIMMLIFLIITLLKLLKLIIRQKVNQQRNSFIFQNIVNTDFICGILLLIYLLINQDFRLYSLSRIIIILFASICYFFYLKKKTFNTIYDFTIFSLIFPCMGIIDLMINNHLLLVSNFSIMILTCVLVYFSFKGEKVYLF